MGYSTDVRSTYRLFTTILTYTRDLDEIKSTLGYQEDNRREQAVRAEGGILEIWQGYTIGGQNVNHIRYGRWQPIRVERYDASRQQEK